MKRITHVVGARPNFMKLAPVWCGLAGSEEIIQEIVHTGQHYDFNMSEVFFKQLELPEPGINLGIGSGSHSFQTAQIMMRFEELVAGLRPDLVVVYGDVNSTVAAALVCAKVGIPVAHVEAGLRSFDRTMPEEINRLLTDQIAKLLFTPSVDGDENLLCEGISGDKIHRVGNVMIDTLMRLLPVAEPREILVRFALQEKGYGLVTQHRPANVDSPGTLRDFVGALADISCKLPLLFPVHPRTRCRLQEVGTTIAASQLRLIDPLGYLDFLALQRHAALVITDSGGIQEETTFLGVPCLTTRPNTERPVTVFMGTNTLVGHDTTLLRREVQQILDGGGKRGRIPPLWDGRAGERIAEIIIDWQPGIV